MFSFTTEKKNIMYSTENVHHPKQMSPFPYLPYVFCIIAVSQEPVPLAKCYFEEYKQTAHTVHEFNNIFVLFNTTCHISTFNTYNRQIDRQTFIDIAQLHWNWIAALTSAEWNMVAKDKIITKME